MSAPATWFSLLWSAAERNRPGHARAHKALGAHALVAVVVVDPVGPAKDVSAYRDLGKRLALLSGRDFLCFGPVDPMGSWALAGDVAEKTVDQLVYEARRGAFGSHRLAGEHVVALPSGRPQYTTQALGNLLGVPHGALPGLAIFESLDSETGYFLHTSAHDLARDIESIGRLATQLAKRERAPGDVITALLNLGAPRAITRIATHTGAVAHTLATLAALPVALYAESHLERRHGRAPIEKAWVEAERELSECLAPPEDSWSAFGAPVEVDEEQEAQRLVRGLERYAELTALMLAAGLELPEPAESRRAPYSAPTLAPGAFDQAEGFLGGPTWESAALHWLQLAQALFDARDQPRAHDMAAASHCLLNALHLELSATFGPELRRLAGLEVPGEGGHLQAASNTVSSSQAEGAPVDLNAAHPEAIPAAALHLWQPPVLGDLLRAAEWASRTHLRDASWRELFDSPGFPEMLAMWAELALVSGNARTPGKLLSVNPHRLAQRLREFSALEAFQLAQARKARFTS